MPAVDHPTLHGKDGKTQLVNSAYAYKTGAPLPERGRST
jgi:hypothetical protein